MKTLPLSVRVIILELTVLLSGKVFSVNCFRSSNLPSTTLDGSLTMLLVPACNIYYLQWLDIIVHVIDCSSGQDFNFDFSFWFLNYPFNATQHWITSYESGISTPFLKGSFRCSSLCVWFSIISLYVLFATVKLFLLDYYSHQISLGFCACNFWYVINCQ